MTVSANPLSLFDSRVVVEQPSSLPPSNQLHQWRRAFDQWLAGLPAANTRRAYQRAWHDLLDFTGKPPWTIHSDDVRDWVQDLAERPIDARVAKGLKRKGRREGRSGYAPSTIALYLAAISSFFTFAAQCCHVTGPDGRERPLYNGINPVLAVPRPKPRALSQKTYLSAESLFLLLRAIERDSLQGLRDFALLAGYVFTGRRNTEWRTLRWGDLVFRDEKVFYAWNGEDEPSELYQLPPPIWKALQAFLQAAGRWQTIQGGDFVFTPLNDRATRLDNVSLLTWDRNRPLSPGQVNKLLKKYAGRAGLNADQIHIHVLRHSAAKMLEATGFDIHYISKHLAHSSVNRTKRALSRMQRVEDQSWRQVAAVIKMDLL